MSDISLLQEQFGASDQKLGSFDAMRVGDNLSAAIGVHTPVRDALDRLRYDLPSVSEIGYFAAAYSPVISRFDEIVSTQKQKELARVSFNQDVAKAFYLADTWDEESVSGMHKFMQVVTVMHENGVTLGTMMYQYMLGARAHAGIMHAFENNGFSLYMPDGSAELERWDVKGKTDFAAVHKAGYILLVDARGARRVDTRRKLPGIRAMEDDAWHFESPKGDRREKTEVLADILSKDPYLPNGYRAMHFNITLYDEQMRLFGRLKDIDRERMLVRKVRGWVDTEAGK